MSHDQPIKIALHIGANLTDEDRLLKTALKNISVLHAQSIAVPGPGRYRKYLRRAAARASQMVPDADTRATFIDQFLDDAQANKVLLSSHNLIAPWHQVFHREAFYADTEAHLTGMDRIFEPDEIEFFLELRNPATLIPDCFAQQAEYDYDGFMRGQNPLDARWSDVVAQITDNLPDAPLTVWCNEESPIIWADIIRAYTGLDGLKKVEGEWDPLYPLLTEEGQALLTDTLAAMTPDDKHGALAEILQKHGVPSATEQEIDLPIWSQDTVDRITDAYYRDVDLIAQLPRVRFLMPNLPPKPKPEAKPAPEKAE